MQTNLADFIKDTAEGQEADAILRKCVHCGFCTATCPTYQLLSDELDGPRGRIYLIKQVLEGDTPTARTQMHLDRCLSCRACETTCPSGVRYGRLVDIGRDIVEQRVRRPILQRLLRRTLRAIIPYPRRFTPLLRIGQSMRAFLPASLKRKIPARHDALPRPRTQHQRRVLLLEGCVQPAIAPQINASAARVLDQLGITIITSPAAGCCGAVSYHLGAHAEGLDFMRRNIDAWWPHVEAGVEALVMTASGCGSMVREYGELLAGDPQYKDKAERISTLSCDLAQLVAQQDLSALQRPPAQRVAFQSPCSLQHALKIRGAVESILTQMGHQVLPVADAHLCCGSAGTYSILQPQLSQRLLTNKLSALQIDNPDIIATANIGCMTHLSSAATRAVVHWIDLLDAR
jgi:glycolate oxidase iron-sulfur subunit